MFKKVVFTFSALSGLVIHVLTAFVFSPPMQSYVADGDFFSSEISKASVAIDAKINSIIRDGIYHSVSEAASDGYDWRDLGMLQLYVMEISELYRVVNQQGVISSLVVDKFADTFRDDNDLLRREYYEAFKPHIDRYVELSVDYSERVADLDQFRDRSAQLVSDFQSQTAANIESSFQRDLNVLLRDAFESEVLGLGEDDDPIDFVGKFSAESAAIVSAYSEFAKRHADFVEDRNSFFDYVIAFILLIASLAPWAERGRDDDINSGQTVDATQSS
ncbi:hypothetical protein [Marinobacter lipolyticus]|uniref:hypothetical protein n=1 Tax=Marinobacter lipolyticus TaxID=209639 RepID=UPI003A939317